MKKISLILALAFLFTNILAVGAFGYSFNPPAQSTPVSNQSYVTPDFSTGKLTYTPYDSIGNTISDYTSAGYFAGEYELPVSFSGRDSIIDGGTVYPKTWTDAQISAGEADDAYYINEAINAAAAMIKDNQIAVVKLAPGTYYIPMDYSGKLSSTNKINWKGSIQLKSNVILLGSGQGPTGTILYAYEIYDSNKVAEKIESLYGKKTADDEKSWGTAYRVIEMRGTSNPSLGTTSSMIKTRITENYIEAGSNTFTVADISKFNVGDTIRIQLPRSDKWSDHIKMSNSSYEGESTGWSAATNPDRFNRVEIDGVKGSDPDRIDVRMERVITAKNGNEITVDIPFFVHVDKSLEDEAYPYEIIKINQDNKIVNAGVENLRIYSEYDKKDYNPDGHAGYGVSIYRAKNCFVQNVTFKQMRHSAVYCHGYTKQITVRGCSSLDPKSTIDGGFRYTFSSDGDTQQNLFTGCYTEEGRHDYKTSYTATGPIVFVDNVAEAASTTSETHGVWSTGVLYDNLIHIGNNTATTGSTNVIGLIAAANRGLNGTLESQGWTSAGTIIWNSLSPMILVHDVPGDYQNFVFGIWGYYNKLSGKRAQSSVSTNLNQYKDIFFQDNGKPSNAFNTYSNSPIIGNATVQSPTAPVEPRSLFKAQLAERVTGNFTNAKDNAPTIVNPNPDYETTSASVTIDGFCEKGATKVNIYIDNKKYEVTPSSSDYSFKYTVTLSNGTHKIYATQVIDGDESCKTPDRFVSVNGIGTNQSYLSSEYPASTLSLIKNDSRMTYDEYLETFIVDELPQKLDQIPEANVISGSKDGTSEVTLKDQNGEEMTIGGRYVILPGRVAQLRGYTVSKSDYGFLISDDGINYKEEKFASQLDLKGDAFGVCFYNLAKIKTKYWFKQYVVYEDEDGEKHTIESEPYIHEFK